MAKQSDREHVPVMGWFHPHAPVDWTGEILDVKTGELVKEPSMTKQAFVAECDINNIIREFGVTGVARHINENRDKGLYADLPEPLDFQQSLNIVLQAQSSFDSLPAQVRARFGNNPEQFLGFLSDPANQEEAIKLGLATDNRPVPQPEPPPQKVEIVNPKDEK